MAITDPRFLDRDPLSGAVSYFYSDETGENYTIVRTEDIEPLLEMNQWARNQRHGRWGEMTHVASMPMSVWYDLKQKGILEDQTELTRWHNASENQVFRVRPGRV